MAAISRSESRPGTERPRWRWEALRPTPRFRRQLLRGLLVVLIFIGIVAGLALLFGISILQYTLAGFVVGTIVMVAAIGLTLI